MEKETNIVEIARRTLRIEAEALHGLAAGVGASFAECVHAIFAAKGRLVVTGIGKTALVAKKVVATLNSTGTPAIFLHAADAIHGDIGMVQPSDLILCISKSGETEEIKVVSLLARQLGNPLIALTAREDSTLARRADFLLHTPMEREADPNDLAPTTSTTLQMAMGDALAISLLALRGFSPEDFARYHPGGSLGKQLYLRVRDLYPHNQSPHVRPTTSLKDTLLEMTANCLGATAVLDDAGGLVGIVTDGDLRRLLNHRQDITDVTAGDLMTRTPKWVNRDTLALRALEQLRTHNISQLVVTDGGGRYLGFVHLHDFIRQGMV